ncbi:MAG: hypothetical protein RLZZ419_316, partial [Pseudomonadota bacterium]
LYPLFVSTLNNKERLNDYFRELSRLHPRPERPGFTLHMDKFRREYRRVDNRSQKSSNYCRDGTLRRLE